MHKVPAPAPHLLKKPNRLPIKSKSLLRTTKATLNTHAGPPENNSDPVPSPKSPVSKNIFKDNVLQNYLNPPISNTTFFITV